MKLLDLLPFNKEILEKVTYALKHSLLTIVIAFGLIAIYSEYQKYKLASKLYKEYQNGEVLDKNKFKAKIDSLTSLVLYQDIIINNQQSRIDSLNNKKTKTNNYYETIIQNMSDVSIVSDDSISRYISSKIHSK